MTDEKWASLLRLPITRLFAVIVVYKMRPSESPSLKTLLEAARQVSSASLELSILVHDNTPGDWNPGKIPNGVLYEAAPENPGLAQAYNRALEIAQAEGYEWILTLDQDTTLPLDYLMRMIEYVHRLRSSLEIAAIVPQVIDQGRNLSPFRFVAGAIPRWFQLGFTGVPRSATYALNSAALIRVAALSELGGYDPKFPLDVSDINLFHRLHNLGKCVFVAGEILVHHEFSLLNKKGAMSMERYRSMLLDECAFWDLNMGSLARLERMMRLVGRACKDSLRSGDHGFRQATLDELKRRLLTSKSRRISEWERWAALRCQRLTLNGSDLEMSKKPEIVNPTAGY